MESLLTYTPNRFGGFSINNFILNKLNMETKEFKVQAPEGYEIDREKSTLDCIKFKPIRKKNITYEDVCRKLFNHTYYFTSEHGGIYTFSGLNKSDPNNAINRRQLRRILALNQLLTIAEYYNKIREEYNIRYAITYDFNKCKFNVKSAANADIHSFGVVALFDSEEDAQEVIDNPNFKEILNIVYKD